VARKKAEVGDLTLGADKKNGKRGHLRVKKDKVLGAARGKKR